MHQTVFEVVDKSTIAYLFADWEETFIWSCLQDQMGRAYADGLDAPASAKICCGNIVFFAGDANAALVRHRPEESLNPFAILVPQTEAWEREIEHCFGECATRCTRFATKKESDAFDAVRLQAYVDGLQNGYVLRFIDRELYQMTRTRDWARDLCSNYDSYEAFAEKGLGVVALKDGEIMAGASSYVSYLGGIEIEVDTREDARRKGLALACAAKLILECLRRELYPSWDAHTRASLALAEKLGYQLSHTYTAYEVVYADGA